MSLVPAFTLSLVCVMLSLVRRAACKKFSSAWRACVTLCSAMRRISSGTWKFIGLVAWSP